MLSQASQDAGELPSGAALVARLEAQRAELLRAMAEVDLAQRTVAQHVAGPPPEPLEPYQQRVLEALHDASEALRSAYPMLERVAQALALEKILKEHAPRIEASASKSASVVSKAGPSQGQARSSLA